MKVLSNDINTSLENNLLNDCKNTEVKIAVAFFSNANFIKKIISQKCMVKLIIRLDEGTSPSDLKQLIKLKNIKIKYYSDKNFHPKIYIANKKIYVGSANLTKKAFSSNNEITIKFSQNEDKISYDKISNLFDEYWENAELLTSKILDTFSNKIEKIKPLRNQLQLSLKNTIKNCSFHRKSFSKNSKITKAPYDRSSTISKNPIKGKKFVFTGKLQKYTRSELSILLKKLGATLRTEISGETDYLVDTIEQTRPDKKNGTKKERKFEEQKKYRKNIKKITENQFYKLIERAKS